jgi:transitional endoplasmic reticulum ATPase
LNVYGGAYDFSQFGLLNSDLERALSSSGPTLEELMSTFFSSALASGLERSDYAHLEPRLSTLVAYLRGADRARECGINVLLWGLPGTGKTELARLLGEELEWKGYEVRMSNRDGTPSSGDERIGSYLLAQRFLQKAQQRLVIFDEVEDLFSTEYGFGRARLGKLFMNRLLELNAVPTIWIANSIDSLSLAVRRRFDFSISFGPLPGNVRRRVLQRHLQDEDIGQSVMAKLLRRETLLPAQVSMGKKVADLAATGAERSVVLLEVVDASMRLLEQPLPKDNERMEFDASLANADVDLELAVQGLKAAPGRGIVAIYGPPGAGKSALAGYLAERLERNAVRIGASHVLSAFLGETEGRIARLFEGIDVRSEAVVLEEADELLAARDAARQSWEVRLANELLMRMDGFGGLVVLTTNALDRIDVAVLRRCHLKIKLDYLKPRQREAMWRAKTMLALDAECAARLTRLNQLTAGDFVAVAATAAIIGSAWKAADWIAALEKEIALRPPVARSAGFVAGD